MLRDAEHFKMKIGGLDGASDAGDYLVNLVKAKNVPRATIPTPPSPPTPPVEEKATKSDVVLDEVADLEKAPLSEEAKA
ncbi:hypothetical protein BUE80_DR013991 [Diplocarpon rosae]|nr:hypothetical protein BUE80_DR013991 [Diplocarpon rosae]